ncbi:hypothetical protein QFC21_006838 [Naganishia friedmannii]|uniref:Uncharacterized protein n=1 Tax=Naganishia friedmannii TaxID=89922 RepID=A0ACC2V185_9TREE|nr:hypothetical protein QFC21_006838 [Naganishia friedmannii]
MSAPPPPTDWQWFPANQCYYSPSTGVWAAQDQRTGEWTYHGNQGAAALDQNVEQNQADRVQGGGIGDVGWALEADIVDEPDREEMQKRNGNRTLVEVNDKQETSDSTIIGISRNATTTSKNASDNHVSPTPSTTALVFNDEATHRISSPEAQIAAPVPKILRLVLLPLTTATATTTASPSSSSAPKPRVAILDSRPSGYLIGRDRSLGSAVLRVKAMGVSRVHARVWRGFREAEDGERVGEAEVVGRETEREKGWWIVDCGSTHGTFLSSPSTTTTTKPTPHRLSASRESSLPHKLQHGTLLTLGPSSATFSVHLHPDWPCDECALGDLPALGIDDPLSTSTAGTPDPSADGNTGTAMVAAGGPGAAAAAGGQWNAVEPRQVAMTSQAKKIETSRRAGRAMKSLKERYFGAPPSAAAGSAAEPALGNGGKVGRGGGAVRGKAGQSGKHGRRGGTAGGG